MFFKAPFEKKKPYYIFAVEQSDEPVSEEAQLSTEAVPSQGESAFLIKY